jgi:hypothetical protein
MAEPGFTLTLGSGPNAPMAHLAGFILAGVILVGDVSVDGDVFLGMGMGAVFLESGVILMDISLLGTIILLAGVTWAWGDLVAFLVG